METSNNGIQKDVLLCVQEVKESILKTNSNEKKHNVKQDGSVTIDKSNNSIQEDVLLCVQEVQESISNRIVMKRNIMENKMDESPWTTATIQSKKCTSVCAGGEGKQLNHHSNEKKHDGKPDGSITMDNSNNSIKKVYYCVCRM